MVVSAAATAVGIAVGIAVLRRAAAGSGGRWLLVIAGSSRLAVATSRLAVCLQAGEAGQGGGEPAPTHRDEFEGGGGREE